MAWQITHQRSVVPGGVPVIVPPTTVSAGGSVGITPTHKAAWYVIRNTGTAVDIRIAFSTAALAAGVFFPIGPGDSQTISAAEAIRRIVVGAPAGGADGQVAALISLTRQPVNANAPELTVANDFPAFDALDTDNIVPGVGA